MAHLKARRWPAFNVKVIDRSGMLNALFFMGMVRAAGRKGEVGKTQSSCMYF